MTTRECVQKLGKGLSGDSRQLIFAAEALQNKGHALLLLLGARISSPRLIRIKNHYLIQDVVAEGNWSPLMDRCVEITFAKTMTPAEYESFVHNFAPFLDDIRPAPSPMQKAA